MEQGWFVAGAVVACLAVAFGAFAAHALKARLSPDDLSTFETGARYQMYHGLALLGVAYASARSTGVTMHQAVREKIAQIACYREGINAHLTAAVELAEPSPGGLLMPNQPTMYSGPCRRRRPSRRTRR